MGWSNIFVTGIGIVFLIMMAEAKCPETMPIRIEDKCYRIETNFLQFYDARDNCMQMENGAMITSIKSPDVLKKIEDQVNKLVTERMKTALFWIGLSMDDDSMTKLPGDRNWRWDYDDSQIIQKSYTLWDVDGGPSKKDLSCAIVNASNDFLVQAVDCSRDPVSVICMMNASEAECTHSSLPYLMYGDYCLAGLNGTFEYNEIQEVCNPNKPTQYTEELKNYVIMAARNAVLGGGLYVYMGRSGYRFFDLSDFTEPPEEMWEEGEPRDEYNCVGLTLQLDNTLKLKTMNCNFMAASLCAFQPYTSFFEYDVFAFFFYFAFVW